VHLLDNHGSRNFSYDGLRPLDTVIRLYRALPALFHQSEQRPVEQFLPVVIEYFNVRYKAGIGALAENRIEVEDVGLITTYGETMAISSPPK
jgi:hypothetical protein